MAMPTTIDPDARTAAAPSTPADHPVTLINSFVVDPARDEAFLALWTEASRYFRSQPGFVSLRFHRAVTPDADYRYVNVASWASLADFQAAHATDEFRALVTQDVWKEFPANPALYEVVVADDGAPAAARR
jgi:heme-degrading monooxygenase HmoA